MASPGLPTQFAEVEAQARLLTGMCLGCGKTGCAGCWDPLSKQERPVENGERVWLLPLSEADRRSIRADAVRRRQRLGIPTRDLARHAGVTHQAVSHWERDDLFAIGDQRVVGIVEFLDEAERELGEVDLPSPEALRTRMLKVLALYRIARKKFAARAGVSRGCISTIAQSACTRHYRETLAIVRALDDVCSSPPPPQKPRHGTLATYSSGCRCRACRAVNTGRAQGWRKAAAVVAATDPSKVPHGESGYTNWRCRCPVCKAAGSEANRRERLRRKVRAAPRPGSPDLTDQDHKTEETPNHG